MNEVQALRGAMAGQAAKVPLPDRFEMVSVPDASPSIIVKDTETGRTADVPLGEARGLRRTLLLLFGDAGDVREFVRGEELARLRGRVEAAEAEGDDEDGIPGVTTAVVNDALAAFDRGEFVEAAQFLRTGARAMREGPDDHGCDWRAMVEQTAAALVDFARTDGES